MLTKAQIHLSAMQICILLPVLKYKLFLLWVGVVPSHFFLICPQLSKSLWWNKMLRFQVASNSASRHFDLRYCHAELPATQRVIIFKQNVEMSSCLQLNMCSFFNKLLRCRVHSNSARRHVETKCWDAYLHATQQVVISIQYVDIQSRENIFLSPDIQILSSWNSGSRYLEWPF